MKKPKISQVWKYEPSLNEFIYPENHESYNDFFKHKQNFGISFSGGGTRAATCALGQLRGLDKIGVLNNAKYIASNSGGTWGSLPYLYYRGDLNNYFGEYFSPENLTIENVTEIPEKTFLHQMTEANILLETLINRIIKKERDESFSHAVAKIFLKPLKIPYVNKLFTLNEVSFEKLKSNNPEIKLNDFTQVVDGRPFHIANGTLHNWKFSKEGWNESRLGKDRLYHVEMTPLYAGVKVFHRGKGDHNTDIGGAYLDPFAFDSFFKRKIQKENVELIEIEYRTDSSFKEKEFTLADIMGISGSAATSADISVDKLKLEKKSIMDKLVKFIKNIKYKLIKIPLFLYKGASYITNSLPELHHFSPISATEENHGTIEYNVGDGGPVDDIALMPLLARGVPKILCFCNVQYKILKENNSNVFEFNENNFDDDVLCFFGLKKKNFSRGIESLEEQENFQQVFCKEDFWKLSEAFEQAMKSNKPLIYEGTHKVMHNPHFGIKGGNEVNIMWFYNERCKAWEEKIDTNIFEELKDEIGEKGFGKRLKNFPNFKTFGENAFKIIEMHPSQATLLSNYQTWIIDENKEKIQAFLSMGND